MLLANPPLSRFYFIVINMMLRMIYLDTIHPSSAQMLGHLTRYTSPKARLPRLRLRSGSTPGLGQRDAVSLLQKVAGLTVVHDIPLLL